MQNSKVKNKEHYGMLRYFLERSIVQYLCSILTAYIISASRNLSYFLRIPPCSASSGQVWCFAVSLLKFSCFASIVVILPAFRWRKLLSLQSTVDRHQPFMSWLPFLLRLLLFLTRLLNSQLALLKLLRHQWLSLRYFLLFFCFGKQALRATRFFATRLRIFLFGIFLYFRM